jgi:hypothetical protein
VPHWHEALLPRVHLTIMTTKYSLNSIDLIHLISFQYTNFLCGATAQVWPSCLIVEASRHTHTHTR